MTAVVLQLTGVPLAGLLELSVAEVYFIIDHDCLGEPSRVRRQMHARRVLSAQALSVDVDTTCRVQDRSVGIYWIVFINASFDN